MNAYTHTHSVIFLLWCLIKIELNSRLLNILKMSITMRDFFISIAQSVLLNTIYYYWIFLMKRYIKNKSTHLHSLFRWFIYLAIRITWTGTNAQHVDPCYLRIILDILCSYWKWSECVRVNSHNHNVAYLISDLKIARNLLPWCYFALNVWKS